MLKPIEIDWNDFLDSLLFLMTCCAISKGSWRTLLTPELLTPQMLFCAFGPDPHAEEELEGECIFVLAGGVV